MTDPPAPSSLSAALDELDLQLPLEQRDQLDRYRGLLWHWNEQLNLTRHTDFRTFASRDIVDSLQLSRLLGTGEQVLDVGSGGGVPGIVLAILRPDLDLCLCESVGKKAKVLDRMVAELGLPTAVHHGRAEGLLEEFGFDALVARAIGPLWKVCTWFEPYWHSISRLLLIKGPRWLEERAAARERGVLKGLALRRVAEYPMSGTSSSSVIVQLTPSRTRSG
ncbi:MAG: 16S rRNA (guanine(527)-N(7))-methyltransferase RsmG [Pirellulaceae bacterium]